MDGRENETGSVIAELFLHVPMRWRVLVFVNHPFLSGKKRTWRSRRPRPSCTGTQRSSGSWELTSTFPRWRRLDLLYRGGFLDFGELGGFLDFGELAVRPNIQVLEGHG